MAANRRTEFSSSRFPVHQSGNAVRYGLGRYRMPGTQPVALNASQPANEATASMAGAALTFAAVAAEWAG